jgi:phage gpG-like protein
MASWQKAVAALRKFKTEIPLLVANEMVNFALDNMRTESFAGVPWAPRKANAARNSGRRLLIDTADGERSIKASRVNESVVEVIANEYMEAHNTGANINTTVVVHQHTRKRKGRSEEVKSHSRRMNVKLPKRTFIEPSKELDNRIEKALTTRFKKLINGLP